MEIIIITIVIIIIIIIIIITLILIVIRMIMIMIILLISIIQPCPARRPRLIPEEKARPARPPPNHTNRGI